MASIRDFSVRWVLLPTLYAAATLPVLIASVSASFVGGGAVWAFFCRFICGSGGLLALLLLIGAPVFGLLSLGIARVERLRPPLSGRLSNGMLLLLCNSFFVTILLRHDIPRDPLLRVGR